MKHAYLFTNMMMMMMKFFVTLRSVSITAVPQKLMLSALASSAPKLFAVGNLYSASLS